MQLIKFLTPFPSPNGWIDRYFAGRDAATGNICSSTLIFPFGSNGNHEYPTGFSNDVFASRRFDKSHETCTNENRM